MVKLPFAAAVLRDMLAAQLGGRLFRVQASAASSGQALGPNLAVFPDGGSAPDSPAALVVEMWSPEPGACDLRTGLRTYQQRGDAEIWFVHAGRRRVTVWQRQPDGSYSRTSQSSGELRPARLPGVRIDVKQLFDAAPAAESDG